MKYWKIILKNICRNKRRTMLTILSIGFSLFLVTFLRTLIVQLTRENPSPVAARRVVVRRATSLQEMMPESYGRKIEGLQEVQLVLAMDWFGGIYQEEKNFFANFSVEHDKLFAMFPEIELGEDAKEAFAAQKSAAICGRQLAERFRWKVGDRITLLGTIYPVDLEFTLTGIYRSISDESSFYFHRDYFEEAQGKPGLAGAFYVLCSSPEAVPKIIDGIDSTFRNTNAETRTETERAFESSFQIMIGNVQGLVLSISSVVVFMILLVVGNTMAMNIRERSHEIAILKSLGFQNESLIGMLMAESVSISLMGGLVGCLSAKFLFANMDFSNMTMGFIRDFQVDPPTMALGGAISLLVGVVCGGIPALHVSRLTVAEGLRRIG